MVEMKMVNGDFISGEIITKCHSNEPYSIAAGNPQFLVLKDRDGNEKLINQKNILFIHGTK